MKEVTAGIIIKGNLVLIAQRAPNDKLAGKWEFPSGKIEPRETPLYLSRVGRLSKSLWFGTDQYCLEDEGAVAGVCAEEDGEGLIDTIILENYKTILRDNKGENYVKRSTTQSLESPF